VGHARGLEQDAARPCPGRTGGGRVDAVHSVLTKSLPRAYRGWAVSA